jgi:hypothetical protein
LAGLDLTEIEMARVGNGHLAQPAKALARSIQIRVAADIIIERRFIVIGFSPNFSQNKLQRLSLRGIKTFARRS